MTVREIVDQFLIKNGFDGLFGDGCGCETGDLMPCDDACENCSPGYKKKCDCGENCPWHLGPNKDSET